MQSKNRFSNYRLLMIKYDAPERKYEKKIAGTKKLSQGICL